MTRRWGQAGLIVVAGLLAAALLWSRSPVVASVVLLAAAGLAALASPAAFPRPVGAAEAQERSAADGRPIIYFRPGCPCCARLRTTLGRRARRAYWVDIWADPAGAAAVRAVTGGDETVPTVVIGGISRVNPPPAWVRSQLR